MGKQSTWGILKFKFGKRTTNELKCDVLSAEKHACYPSLGLTM